MDTTNRKPFAAGLMAAFAVAGTAAVSLLPAGAALAQDGGGRRWEERREIRRDVRRDIRQDAQNRQNTKNQWRNLSAAAGAATVYGLLKHDSTVTFLGAAGTLYSLNRYEQDRKSQSQTSRARAELFGRPAFDREGHHFVRETVTRDGQRYYRFVRR